LITSSPGSRALRTFGEARLVPSWGSTIGAGLLGVRQGPRSGDEIGSLAVGEQGDVVSGGKRLPLEPLPGGVATAAGGYLFGMNPDGSYNSKDLGIGKEGSIRAAEKIRQLGQQGVLPAGGRGQAGGGPGRRSGFDHLLDASRLGDGGQRLVDEEAQALDGVRSSVDLAVARPATALTSSSARTTGSVTWCRTAPSAQSS